MNDQNEKAQKAKTRAEEYAPGEVWTAIIPGLYLAASRNPVSERQSEVLEQEIAQARILITQGHTVYLLPEHGPRGEKHPDAVVDGLIMEFKTITGNIRKIAENFKAAREKAENVFLKIVSDFSKDTVQWKLRRTIINKEYQGGLIIAYFAETGKTFYWDVDDLR